MESHTFACKLHIEEKVSEGRKNALSDGKTMILIGKKYCTVIC